VVPPSIILTDKRMPPAFRGGAASWGKYGSWRQPEPFRYGMKIGHAPDKVHCVRGRTPNSNWMRSRHGPLPLLPASYRVVVRAREPSRRGEFIWEIVRGAETVMESASRSFRTMEEAYTEGAIALRRYNTST